MSEHPDGGQRLQTEPAPEDTTREDTASGEAAPDSGPSSLTFRITPVSLLGVLAVTICASPLALSTPRLAALYLIPVALTAWIVRTRTVIDDQRIVARRVLHRTRFGWDEIQFLRLNEKRWVRAVLVSGRTVTLPTVRVRDLPHLARLSGGRLPDPTRSVEASGSGAETPGESRAADATATPHPDES